MQRTNSSKLGNRSDRAHRLKAGYCSSNFFAAIMGPALSRLSIAGLGQEKGNDCRWKKKKPRIQQG